MKPNVNYIVVSLQGSAGKQKWKPVTPDPIPRPQAAQVVKLEWARGRFARAVPQKMVAAA